MNTHPPFNETFFYRSATERIALWRRRIKNKIVHKHEQEFRDYLNAVEDNIQVREQHYNEHVFGTPIDPKRAQIEEAQREFIIKVLDSSNYVGHIVNTEYLDAWLKELSDYESNVVTEVMEEFPTLSENCATYIIWSFRFFYVEDVQNEFDYGYDAHGLFGHHWLIHRLILRSAFYPSLDSISDDNAFMDGIEAAGGLVRGLSAHLGLMDYSDAKVFEESKALVRFAHAIQFKNGYDNIITLEPVETHNSLSSAWIYTNPSLAKLIREHCEKVDALVRCAEERSTLDPSTLRYFVEQEDHAALALGAL